MKSKKKKPLIFALVLAATVGAATIWIRRNSDWDFVRQVTGFRFPMGTEYLAQHDNAEWFIVSVVRLPKNSVPTFIHEYGFTKGRQRDMITASSLPEKYRKISDGNEVLWSSSQKEYQTWEAILDPQSQLLWIQVTYPDWAGDHSGTASQSRNLP